MKGTTGLVISQNVSGAVTQRLQAQANARGHGKATHVAGLGGLLGAMLGSFGGIGWVLIAAGAGGALGFYIGEQWDGRD